MKLDVLCNDGSPLQITMKSLYGEDGRLGIGGAENALLTMCEAWHNDGHEVTLYNNPDQPNASPFQQKALTEFNGQEERDILIVFRSPNTLAKNAKGKIIWWSCDPHTTGDFAEFSSIPDAIVSISEHHASYLLQKYGITDAHVIDIPVRMMDYQEDVEKVPYQCIFNSVPDRGLLELQSVWGRIVAQVPEATLKITSDWRLWNKNIHQSTTLSYQRAFLNMPGVTYLGAIPRKEMVKLQQSSELHLYPCIFEEMFCLHPDSYVSIKDGHKKISSIEVGDEVLSSDGEFHRVTDVVPTEKKNDTLLYITSIGNDRPLKITKEHKVLVSRYPGYHPIKNTVKDGLQRKSLLPLEWSRADELNIGDYLVYPVREDNSSYHSMFHFSMNFF